MRKVAAAACLILTLDGLLMPGAGCGQDSVSGKVWDSISLLKAGAPIPEGPETDVYHVLTAMDERWNAQDLTGYLTYFLRSPTLLTIIGADYLRGWNELERSYLRGFSDPHDMGSVETYRIQVQMVELNVALAVEWWTMKFPSGTKTVGTSTMNLIKTPEGWKVYCSHTTFLDM